MLFDVLTEITAGIHSILHTSKTQKNFWVQLVSESVKANLNYLVVHRTKLECEMQQYTLLWHPKPN